ncbi:MAG TPA: MFS transporter [Saprospiraceae bacterium]|nr:MFS transporter [Saprospiraceae bacterium]
MDATFRLKLSLYLNYFVFAILLNSVGIVILKSIAVYGVDEVQASTLELFKDMSIAIVSLGIASFLPRIGYKRAMLAGLALVTFGSIAMALGNSFTSARLLFLMVGVSFALIKVSVYSMIGMVTSNEKEHSALMSSIEGVFMFGIALASFLFPAFNVEGDSSAWLRVYWVLAVLTSLSFLFLWFTPGKEQATEPGSDLMQDLKRMARLLVKQLVLVFVISAFLFVMIEQGIMTWLPTFNKEVLHLPENISIMMASILSFSLGIGRLAAGYFSGKMGWHKVLLICLAGAMAIVVFILPKTVNAGGSEIQSFGDLPLLAFAFPLVGLFIAPIYPLLNSAVLSALPQQLHSPMTGLIVIFSAIGGTLGSRMIGYLFKHTGADQAFYYTLIPMAVLVICVTLLRKLTIKSGQNISHNS